MKGMVRQKTLDICLFFLCKHKMLVSFLYIHTHANIYIFIYIKVYIL